MKNTVALPMILALLSTAPFASAANITGKVVLKGTAPPERDIIMTDPLCGKLHDGKPTPTTRFYVVGKEGGLAETLVYLREGVNGTFTPPEEPAKLDQVDCYYTPHVLGLQTGQKLLIYNSDPLLHNVRVESSAPGKMFNRAQFAKAKPFEHVYDRPEIFVRYRCDIHPWMFGYVAVVEHPFFAVSDENGSFTIKNVPPGQYTIEAIHRRTHAPTFKGLTQEITVGEDDVKVEFVVEPVQP